MSINGPTGGGVNPIDVGDTLGQYKLVELIAIGGMGVVYRAYEKSLDRYVAVKVLSHELARDSEIATRFLNEARASATLNHPNVVHVYSAGEQGGTYYFAMELVTGEHMEALLARQHELPVREAVEYIRQTALGLQHAHEHGIIHGDVKPANFLVSDTGVVKVTDFGLARRLKATSGRPTVESLFGTPGYISPEVVQGQMPDHRSDIYSLGATLYHMLCGRAPFTGATPEATMQMHITNPVTPPQEINPKVPPPLNQIVLRMLAKDPSARYQSYAEVIQAFDRFLAERSKTDRPKPGPRGLNRDVTARPPGLAASAPATPAAAPAPAPAAHPRKREVLVSFIFTLIAVIACCIILYIIHRNHGVLMGQAPVIVTNTTGPAGPSQAAQDLEAQARPVFEALKAKADGASTNGQLGLAYAAYEGWPAKYSNTLLQQVVVAERAALLEAAHQKWTEASHQIQTLAAAKNFKEAFAESDRQAQLFSGMSEMTSKVAVLRQSIAAAEKDFLAKQAAEKAAAERARQTRIAEWKTQFDTYILNLQWDKGQQEAQRLLAENAGEPPLKDALTWFQQQMDNLVALRQGIQGRLTNSPSALMTLTTKQGEVQAQAVNVETNSVTLRRPLGEAGFAEQTVGWNELTPASACRLFMTCLDKTKPKELLGYAVLITHQALAKQARLEDARQTLQGIEKLDPAETAFVNRLLNELTIPAPMIQPPHSDIPPRVESSGSESEAEAQALWAQMQAAALQGKWPKVKDALALLASDYGDTGFIKAHADDIQKLTQAATQRAVTKGFIALDIGEACNADFIVNPDGHPVAKGFLGSNQFATDDYIANKGGNAIGLPADGRIAVPDATPPLLFQLRTTERKDAIGLTATDGAYPNEVRLDLLPNQQRKYSSLALLFANSTGHSTFRVTMEYSSGDPETAKIKSVDWVEPHLPKEMTVAVTASRNLPVHEAHLYSQVIEINPKSKLVALTFTWLSANTESPAHCTGIFAVSGLPADAGR